MIDFARLYNVPHEPAGALAVRLDGRPIGTVSVSADGHSAYVIVGIGLDSEGGGHVYDRDRFGRPCDLYRAAAALVLREGGHAARLVE
jgi:hypothetical protein